MHDAKDKAFWTRKVKIEIEVLSLLALHGSVCLALRHPMNTGESRKMMVEFVKQAGRYLVDLRALTPAELIDIERIEAAEGSEDIMSET